MRPLESITSRLSDEELREAYLEIKHWRFFSNEGVLPQGVVRKCHAELEERLNCPQELKTVEEAILFEIAKRKYEPKRVQVGDEIKITGNSNAHEFEIGQHVRVIEWEYFGDVDEIENGVEASDGKNSWFIRHEDYVVIR